ncbi:MAG: ATP-binding cassette domain-containing protein, partial [Clostridia bacterium]|nr:ATP-binding cassette domain-containing protein [Clostridia bacterium]
MLKTLMRQIKEYKTVSILTPTFAALEVLMEVLIPFTTASLIDQGIQAGNMAEILKYGLYMILLAFLSLFFGVAAAKTAAKASAGFAYNLREAMYETVQTFSFSNIDKFSTAGLITRMTTDVSNIQNAFQMILRIAVRAPLTMICSMVMCFVINQRLSLIFLVALVILAVVLFSIIRVVSKLFQQVFQKYDALNASVQENVFAIRVVKAFVREEHETSKFTKAAENVYKLFVKAESIVALNGPFMMLIVYGCIIALSWFGAHFIVAGNLTTGELTSLFSYVMSTLMSLMMLSMIFVMLTMSTASGKRICEVLHEKPDIVNPANPVMEVKDGTIDFNHAFFSYHKGSGEDALKDIDLHIHSGETIGIIGGTGCGNSSLVNLISRLYDVKSGSVCVGGLDVREYDLDTLRNQVA